MAGLPWAIQWFVLCCAVLSWRENKAAWRLPLVNYSNRNSSSLDTHRGSLVQRSSFFLLLCWLTQSTDTWKDLFVLTLTVQHCRRTADPPGLSRLHIQKTAKASNVNIFKLTWSMNVFTVTPEVSTLSLTPNPEHVHTDWSRDGRDRSSAEWLAPIEDRLVSKSDPVSEARLLVACAPRDTSSFDCPLLVFCTSSDVFSPVDSRRGTKSVRVRNSVICLLVDKPGSTGWSLPLPRPRILNDLDPAECLLERRMEAEACGGGWPPLPCSSTWRWSWTSSPGACFLQHRRPCGPSSRLIASTHKICRRLTVAV